ncbi:MAG: class IV adenylate cyclase [Pirellulales bacterium]
MQFEVEQKHRVEDAATLEVRLAELGATWGEPLQQADEYFAHPARDFAATDEALRIRTVGDRSFVTYKGPKLDATTKTRRELELPLAASHAEFAELLAALGFRPVMTVHKTRHPFELTHAGQTVHGAWDEIDGLGTFVELELAAHDATLAAAKQCIASLAAQLGLGPTERRSYLELLLARA